MRTGRGIEKLGNVRSCRDYYVYWALEWDPILVHFGGPYYLADIINRPDVNNITGCAVNSTSSAPGCNAFYRTSDKPVPHNAYTSGANLVEQCDSLGYSLTHINENYHAEHFQFAKKELNTLESDEDSFDATEISLKGAFLIQNLLWNMMLQQVFTKRICMKARRRTVQQVSS